MFGCFFEAFPYMKHINNCINPLFQPLVQKTQNLGRFYEKNLHFMGKLSKSNKHDMHTCTMLKILEIHPPHTQFSLGSQFENSDNGTHILYFFGDTQINMLLLNSKTR